MPGTPVEGQMGPFPELPVQQGAHFENLPLEEKKKYFLCRSITGRTKHIQPDFHRAEQHR
jgi:hypothetical protein